MDVAAYLSRIGVSGRVAPTLAHLEQLQRAHLTAVPFENLDVYHRRGVHTGADWSVPKIVDRGRGGWCFELNGAFAALLEEVGFSVKRLGATVLLGEGVSDIPTHLSLEVSLDRPYLVDVGFGDSFIRPLPLDEPGPHDGGVGDFGFTVDGDVTTLVAYEDGEALPQYRFGTSTHAAEDFDTASQRLQTAPGLQWTKTPFATRLLDGGPDRVTLLHDRIRFRRGGDWSEAAVPADDWDALLDEWFGLTP